ncbi:MAG: hypothetical protein R3B13_22375 [Polyangiaceae bacterium]
MKLSPWYLAAVLPLPVLYEAGALGAQVAVLGVTLGIFFGTVSLRNPARSSATTSHSGS